MMLANHNAIQDNGYVIERSLRFSSASSQSLTRTPSVAGDRQKFTFSAWVKRGVLGTSQVIFGAGTGTSWQDDNILFNTSNQLEFYISNGSSGRTGALTTTRVFRDCSAWYHILCVWDTANATSSDRMQIWINGIRETAFAVNTVPALNANTFSINVSGRAHGIGSTTPVANYTDGYQAEDYFIDGQALTPSSFGETNPTTGQWVAKKYTGTYGTNGFYLDFKDGTSTTTLGNDKSGNGNNWTLTNFTRSAGVNDCWMLDVPAGNGGASAVQPSGNYAVLNPLQPASSSISEGNLKYLNSSGGANQTGITIELPTGFSFYFEGVPSTQPAANDFSYIGNSSCYYCSSGKIFVNGSVATTVVGFVNGDVVAIAGTVGGAAKVYKNNILMYDATTAICSSSTVINTFSGGIWQMNFGQRAFAYTPPAGFKALCTTNLPTPSIKKPSDHFNVQLSTGANIKTDSETLFTNELEWIKDRANANNHQLIDSVRGSSAVLQSNTTAAETTYTAPSGSSVGWVWRASDSVAVTNNVGSISSQVSANPTSGFSVVTYTGTGVNATVGHGLGRALGLLVVKAIGTPNGVARSWHVWHKALAGTNRLLLNTTDASASVPTVWNSTVPTSSVFSLGTENSVNNITGGASDYVAYCFAEIAGYSKFGSYTGNGSADGPFVYTGFKPKWLLVKRADAVANWLLVDTSRSGGNVVDDVLYPNLGNVEGANDGNHARDYVSNGFKIRTSHADTNASGGTYIYMVFAETPVNYANAR